MINSYLIDINSKIPHVRALATMKVLATIQSRSKMDKAIGVSEWIVQKLSEPLLQRLHDRELRRNILKELKQLANTGDVEKISRLFEVDSIIREDMKLYQYSMQQYQHLLDQENILKYNLENNKAYGQGKGLSLIHI